jgi:hypothetical protein
MTFAHLARKAAQAQNLEGNQVNQIPFFTPFNKTALSGKTQTTKKERRTCKRVANNLCYRVLFYRIFADEKNLF